MKHSGGGACLIYPHHLSGVGLSGQQRWALSQAHTAPRNSGVTRPPGMRPRMPGVSAAWPVCAGARLLRCTGNHYCIRLDSANRRVSFKPCSLSVRSPPPPPSLFAPSPRGSVVRLVPNEVEGECDAASLLRSSDDGHPHPGDDSHLRRSPEQVIDYPRRLQLELHDHCASPVHARCLSSTYRATICSALLYRHMETARTGICA